MIYVRLTNGFGNNLFQYSAARILAEFHNTKVVAIPPTKDYYAIKSLKTLGINFDNVPRNIKYQCNDSNYVEFFNLKYSNSDILLAGYFEDYRYYFKMRKKIKNWYTPVTKRNNNDLVVHIRAGDRLFYKNEFYLKPSVDRFIEAIEKYEFDNLHIVTSMPKWDYITEEELLNINFHVSVPKDNRVPIKDSVEHFNSFVEGLKRYNPIVKHRSVYGDFTFIRTFENILFEHGTMSWWAAFLSDASKVGVYGPWRPWKTSKNKNLSNIPLNGWFKWK